MCDCKPDADPRLGLYCVNRLAPTALYNACPMKVQCVARCLIKNAKFPGHKGDFSSITENGDDECNGWQNHVYGQSDGETIGELGLQLTTVERWAVVALFAKQK